MTQSELGSIVGKSYQLVQRWETGKGKPTTAQLSVVADALGISVLDLVKLAGDKGDQSMVMTQSTRRMSQGRTAPRFVEVDVLGSVGKTYPVRSELLKPVGTYAVIVIADKAMEPQLLKDTPVLVKQVADNEIPYETGGVYVIHHADRLIVRRVRYNDLRSSHKLTLHTDNENYGELVLDAGEIKGMWQVLFVLDQPVH